MVELRLHQLRPPTLEPPLVALLYFKFLPYLQKFSSDDHHWFFATRLRNCEFMLKSLAFELIGLFTEDNDLTDLDKLYLSWRIVGSHSLAFQVETPQVNEQSFLFG